MSCLRTQTSARGIQNPDLSKANYAVNRKTQLRCGFNSDLEEDLG